MAEKNNQDLIEENKRLKLELETYLRGYENILADKILLEEEFKSYKLAQEEQKKELKFFSPGETTVFKAQVDNILYKSEIDEYLNSIWNLQENLSKREEEMRLLQEQNKQLENELENVKRETKYKSKEKSINESLNSQSSKVKNSINNMDDLYKSTLISQKNKEIEKKIKQSTNLEKIKEEQLAEKKRQEEELARLQKLKEEEEIKKKQLEDENKLKQSINNLLNIKKTQEQKLEEIIKKNSDFYKETENQYIFVDNYNTFINELNQEINGLKDQINISVVGTEMIQKQQSRNNKIIEFTNNLETISVKIKQFNEIINDSKNQKLKNSENIQTEIQEKLKEINIILNNNSNQNLISLNNILEKNTEFISQKLEELEQILKLLESNKLTYEKSKKNIEQDINNLKKDIGDFVQKVKMAQSIILNQSMNNLGNRDDGPNIDSIFLKGSMLLGINNFGDKDIFSSTNIFSQEDFIKKGGQDLIRKNWNEICYVYDDYDIHDVNYEIKAVGLPNNSFFSSCSFGFVIGADIKILEFEKDGKKENYNYADYSLEFNIFLKNNQSNRIHVKYQESPSKRNMTEGERRERKFVKNDYYGVSKNLAGQRAKFVLSIKCGFEIIAFQEEFFVKTNDKEYTWGGTVPKEGKRTLIKMSKNKAKFNFMFSQRIRSMTNRAIKNTKMTVPVCFVGGNNEVLKIDTNSQPVSNINLNKEKGVYEVDFKDTNYGEVEFSISGQLINRCRGEWVCELTDKQIEENIPEDYKKNKKLFNDTAKKIIEQYDQEHKNDNIKVPDVIKVGKWVKNNITYDLRYTGRNEIEATEVLKKKIGVCHHFTKLFNALMYSLGYKVIYVSGFALDKKDFYDKADAHAWSLIKIDGKWLPFDATWGIFSGKLPVCHVFKQYFPGGVHVVGTDTIEFGVGRDEGEFIDP